MITFRWWQPDGYPNGGRLYVNGLPSSGKCFLTLKKGSIVLVTDGPGADSAALRDRLVREVVAQGWLTSKDVDNWDAWVELGGQRNHDRREAPPAPIRMPEAPAAHGLDITRIPIKEPIHIQVDHREPEAIVQLLRSAPKVTVEVCALPLGDYVIDSRIIVERKSVADFEASVVDDDKRLFTQSERMKHQPDLLAVCLLEGDVFGRRQRMSVEQITGAITFLGMIQGMNVLNTLDHIHSAYLLVKLGQHAGAGLGYDLALRGKKPKALLSAKLFVLEGIPGVSSALARTLLCTFGSIAAIAAATPAELEEVPGIGRKRAQQIREVLAGADATD